MPIDPKDVLICTKIDSDRSGLLGASPSTPVTTPIVQSSLFTFPRLKDLADGLAEEHSVPVYTRGNNPTVHVAEHALARLERGQAGKCFGSGMGAISAVMLSQLRQGDHVLFVNHIYGPTLQLASHLERFGIHHDVQLNGSLDEVRASLRPETRMIWMESPGTMLLRTLDVEGLASLAREEGILSVMDNSWATPLFQKPLELGVDVVVHSASKYLGGHSDLMAGAVVTTADRMEEIFYRSFLLNGAALSPHDAWLLIRGLKTLPVRMRQHEADALRIVDYLGGHRSVREVFHPSVGSTRPTGGLTGYSGLLSFEIDGGFDQVSAVIDALRIPRIGVSWGGIGSLVLSPNRGTNEVELKEAGIPRGLIRLSVGLEGAEALIEDLDQALRHLDLVRA